MVNIEKDCGPKCRSRQHAAELVIAVSKGNLKQVKLFLSSCHNAASLSDHHGRTVLHIAASFGKLDVIEWLINELGVDLDIKDYESGWTALHRACFMGQIPVARLLITHGASILTRDKEGLTPLDILMKDRLPHVEFESSGLQEVYTWGENANFNLGHESEHRRRNPEMIDYFRKRSISIKQVSMDKYHTMFLTSAGQVYTCGHGRGGRLGHANENTVLEPTLVDALKNDACCQVFAAKDHSLFLMENGSLYSSGMNDYHQLGLNPPPQGSLYPKLVNAKKLKGLKIKGICADRFHSVVYTENAVFTFGLNAGQLGHHKVAGERLITQPRQVSAVFQEGVTVLQVACSQAATVVYTSRGDVFVLHEYQCRRIISKKLNLLQIAVVGGNLDHSLNQQLLNKKGGDELIIALLSKAGQVFLWRATDPVVRRCVWATKRSLSIVHFSLGTLGFALITSDGDAFTASMPKVKTRPHQDKATLAKLEKDHFDSPWTLSELVCRDEVVELSIEKLPSIHRATQVTSDVKGCNLAVLQCQPNACLTEIPLLDGSQMKEHLSNLLNEADSCDVIHDCILQIGNERIATHRYILAHKSGYFKKLFNENTQESPEGNKIVVDLSHVNPALLNQLLLFFYTENCDFLTIGGELQLEYFKETRHDLIEKEMIDYIEIGAGDSKKSAFQVFSENKAKKGSKHSQEQSDEKSKAAKNPLQAFLEMAKKFGVSSLIKRLEAVKITKDGKIDRVKGRHLPSPSICFDRHAHENLYDVTLQCSDGKLLQAHRCVLVARLEYFRSMLASGWIETSTLEPLTIPVPGDIMAVILDYLYSDGSAVIESCEDAEFLINVMVVADQFLMSRLRQMCEVACASQINLKNACEVLELCTFYNANQLVVTSQQFITINMAALLESRSLDVLSAPVITDLMRYYKQVVPGMERRMLTPYSGFPTHEYLDKLVEAGRISIKPRRDSTGKEDFGSRKSKAKKKKVPTATLR